jgi:hypothetical protein
LVALILTVASLALGVGANPSVANAASPHRAAVIVDTGGSVQKVVITFSEDSISGIEALQRAGANPVIYAMGPGAAVCRLFGVGRDASPTCLGGQDGDNRYWAYFRAPAGTSSFSYSSVGGGASRVHDGDVEGWKFGTGTAPTYVSLASLLPPPPPPTRPPATTPPATNAPTVNNPGSTGSSGTPGSPRGAVPGGAAVPGAPSSSTLPRTGTAASAADANSAETKNDAKSSDGSTKDANGKTVSTALASSDSDGGGGSAASLIWVAALLAAIAAAILVVRRVRKQTPAH